MDDKELACAPAEAASLAAKLNLIRQSLIKQTVSKRDSSDVTDPIAAGLGQEHQLREHRQGLDVQADLPDSVEPACDRLPADQIA